MMTWPTGRLAYYLPVGWSASLTCRGDNAVTRQLRFHQRRQGISGAASCGRSNSPTAFIPRARLDEGVPGKTAQFERDLD